MQTHSSKHSLARFALLTGATALLSLTAALARPQDEAKRAQDARVQAEEERVKREQQAVLKQMKPNKGQMPVTFAPIATDPEGITFGQASTLLDTRVGGEIQAVAFSPDGTVLAGVGGVSGKPGFLKLWDATGKERISLRQGFAIGTVAFSPDGKLLATGEADGAIHLRDAATGQVWKRLARLVPSNRGNRVLFSPKGDALLAVGIDTGIHIWDVSTGRAKEALKGHKMFVTHLAFSRDGKTLVSASTPEGTIRLWDWPSGKERRALHVPLFNGLKNLSVSADGKTVLTMDYDQLHLWSAETGKEVTPKQRAPEKTDGSGPYASVPQLRQYAAAIFAPDGQTVAVCTLNGGRLVLLDAKTLAKKGVLYEGESGPSMPVYASPNTRVYTPVGASRISTSAVLAFSPDSKRLATVSGADVHLVRVWDVPARKQLTVHQSLSAAGRVKKPIVALAATRDGKTLALALQDHRIALRDVATGDVLHLLRGHGDKVTVVAFSPDGKTLASGSADNTVKVWDCATGKERLTFRGHGNWVYAVAFAPDGKTIASGGYDRLIHLWDAATGKEVNFPFRHNAAVRALAFSPDGKLLASGGNDHVIKLWAFKTSRELPTLKTPNASIRALAFSPDSKLLASAGDDGSAITWDVATGKQRGSFPGSGSEATALAFSPSGMRFAVARLDNTVQVWPVAGPKRPVVLSGHADGVTGVAFTPNGREIITAGYDRSVRLWPATDVPIRLLKGHTGSVSDAIFSPDGKYVLTCSGAPSGDRSLRLWDFATGKELQRYPTDQQVLAVAFAPDGRRFVAGSMGGLVRIIDVKSGRNLHQFKGSMEAVRCVAFSPDGQRVVAGDDKGTMHVWNLKTGKTAVCKGHVNTIRTVAFAPDSKRILSGGLDSTLRLWDANTGKQLRLIKCDTTFLPPAPSGRPDVPPLPPGASAPPAATTGKTATTPPVTKMPGPGAQPAKIVLGVRSAVFLPDGKRALCTEGQVLSVWNLDSGKRVRKITGHFERIDKVVLAQGGKVAVSASHDNMVRLWDLKTGQQFASLNIFQRPQPTGTTYYGPYSTMPAMPAPPPPPKEPAEKRESRKKTRRDAKNSDEVKDKVAEFQDRPNDLKTVEFQPISNEAAASSATPRWSYVVGVSPDGQHLVTAGGPSGQATMDNPAYIVRIWRMPEAARTPRTGPAKQ